LFLKPGAISFGNPAAINRAPAVLTRAKQVSVFIRLSEGFVIKIENHAKGCQAFKTIRSSYARDHPARWAMPHAIWAG
jgi:hypothetical protein